MPKELNFQGVYLPPFLVVLTLSLFAALATAWLMNRYRLSRFFVLPRLVFVSFIGIYVVLIGTFLIRI